MKWIWLCALLLLPACLKSKVLNTAQKRLTSEALVDQKCNGGEYNCLCSVEVNNLLDGVDPNLGRLSTGATSDTPSENIPVTCNTGLYLAKNDPAFFVSYFQKQKNPAEGFGGNELFSPIYYAQTLGYILTVHNHAIVKGHTQLEQLSSEWLKAFWALAALASTPNLQTEFKYTEGTQIVPASTGGGYVAYGTALTAARTYALDHHGSGRHGLYLAIALDRPGRTLKWGLNASPGAYGGLRAFLRKVGYSITADGRVDLGSLSLSARQVGLTDLEKSTLINFVNSNGTQNLNEVLNLIRPWILSHEITFLRTSDGVATWYGHPTERKFIKGTGKGSPYSAVTTTLASNSGYILHRVSNQDKPNPTEVWIEGSEVCSQSSVLSKTCVDLPTGSVTYKIHFGSSGVECVSGPCTGGPNPTATPPPPPPAPTPGGGNQFPPLPEPTPPITCNVNALCLLNNRFKVTTVFKNQFNGIGGTAGVINNSNVSGFFHFGDASNIELIVKILDFGSTIKVFYGQLTNLQFTMRVTDTQTGITRTYQNTAGDCGGIDQNFMAKNQKIKFGKFILAKKSQSGSKRLPAAGSCTPNSTTMCLQNGRIKISGRWRNHYNGSSGNILTSAMNQVTGRLYYDTISNLEALIKVVDFGTHYLVMYGTLSDLEYHIDVLDTVSGISRTYDNPGGNYCGGLDDQTFRK